MLLSSRFVTLLAICFPVWASTDESALSADGFARRTLQAATKGLPKRDDSLALRSSFELHYLEDVAVYDGVAPPMYAHVSLSSDIPTLLLEHVDHHFEELVCRENSLKLKTAPEFFAYASEVISSVPELLIVTAHDRCNQAGGRRSYRVSSHTASRLANTITLSLSPAVWENTYQNRVRMGTVPAESSPTATTEVIPTSTTLSDPGATFTPASVAFNYSLPPDTQMWPLDNQTGPLTVRCANCSTAGTLMLVDAGFTVGNLFDDVGSGKFSNIYFQLQANGLYAIVSLNATTTNSSVVTEEVPIRGIGNSTDTFDILDLFSLSFTRGLGIELGASLAANIDMAFGFEVMVPDNSTITFALEDLFLPDVTGFEQTNFSALPFTSHVSDLELTLFARAFADIGFAISTDLFDSQAVEADAYIDMPNLQLDLTPVKNVDVNCQPAAAAQQSAGSSFDALELSLQFGLAAGVDFDNKNVTGFNQTIGTPTACLAFDEAKGSIVPAASVARNAASASTTSAAAPMAMGVRFGALEVSQGILIAVAVAVGATAVVL